MHSYFLRISFYSFLFFIPINIAASDARDNDYGFFAEDVSECKSDDSHFPVLCDCDEKVQIFKKQCIKDDLRTINVVSESTSAKPKYLQKQESNTIKMAVQESTSAKLRHLEEQTIEKFKQAQFEIHHQNFIKLSQPEKSQSFFESCINCCGQSQVYNPQEGR